MLDDDAGVRKNMIRTLKSLDLHNPRVARLIMDGARDKDATLRKACIDQLSIILTGARLLEFAGELLRQETRPDLRKRLKRLSRDVDWEGTEAEKNLRLAPLDKVEVIDFDLEEEQPPLDTQEPALNEGETPTDQSEADEFEGDHIPKPQVPTPRSGEPQAEGEGHKQELGRRAARNDDERDI